MVTYEVKGDVACITMDDGKVNALSYEMLDQLNGAIDKAESEAKAILLAGREGRFSAGFDLSVMMSGMDQATKLLQTGGELLLRLYGYGRPVVAACTGHAIAGGVLLAATADYRIGAKGDFKLGLNEVGNGMPVPVLARRLAEDRLQRAHVVEATLFAQMYDPTRAAEVGWLDEVATPDALLQKALAKADQLAQFPALAYRVTKQGLRRDSIAHIREVAPTEFDLLMGG